MTEQEAVLILNAVPGLGSVRIRELVARFGSASRVLYGWPKGGQAPVRLPAAVGEAWRSFPREAFLKSETALIRKFGVRVVTLFEAGYPSRLKEIYDPPSLLYIRGRLPGDEVPALAEVGSRRASVYGTMVAEQLAGGLAECGFCVVSGMARGIDSAAHRGALKARGLTAAVMGSGFSHIYPQENRRLADEIAERGAVVTELPMDARPLAGHFPRRNRIVSGLSLGVVVVEASQKSGALITSRLALEQGREVFAVPGRVNHPNAFGVNNLIKQGAKLISGLEDIIEELDPALRAGIAGPPAQSVRPGSQKDRPRGAGADSSTLTCLEGQICAILDKKAVHFDEIQKALGIPASQLMAALLRLEMKRQIRQGAGRMFSKAG